MVDVDKGTPLAEARAEDGKFVQSDTDEQNIGTIAAEIDPLAEKKLVRRLDLYIIPTVMLLYLFSFLDRVNIGNARLFGMEDDLGLKGQEYQAAVSLFYVTFILFEVPSNLVLKKLTPSRFIATLTILWGIIATCTGLVQDYGQLVACRLLLGIVDAGLFPCLAIYLTFFYTKKELALRIGYLFVSAALAGACGGLLATGIGYMDGDRGMRGWRWILIIEGIPTVILGVAVFFFLPDNPERASFLSREEKDLIQLRTGAQIGYTESAQKQVGNINAGEDTRRIREGTVFRHNGESWEKMWKEVGKATGTKWKVWVELNAVQEGLLNRYEGMKEWNSEGTVRMRYVVRRE